MTAITRSGVELGHLTAIEIVRITSAPDHVRYDIPSWLEELRKGFVRIGEFTSKDAALHFYSVGMPDFPPAFHCMRAGEAIGAAVEAGLVESIGPDTWRWVAS